jgi:hypothetical protein
LAGGKLFILPKDKQDLGVKGAETNIHYTVLCFTSGTGKPVMCLKSSKAINKIPISWKLGIDKRKDIETGETSFETFREKDGERKSMCGGPVCTYLIKTIPLFVGCSPNSSITSELLASSLEDIDLYPVFDRLEGILPVLLLDGHHSRMKLPFLKYINHVDHLWTVCLGVPYGTHLWQVAG